MKEITTTLRIRHNPLARPELDKTPFFVKDPKQNRGSWHKCFNNDNRKTVLELGCGRGELVAPLAINNSDTNYIAIDIKSEMLYLAKLTIEKYFEQAGRNIDNVLIFSCEICCIQDIFSNQDRIDNIYINFCNPWPKTTHKKRRLTHYRQLMKYREFLKDEGTIYFKTDDLPLFEESLVYFEQAGFDLVEVDYNCLPNDSYPMSEHERNFREQGLKINYLKAVKKPI